MLDHPAADPDADRGGVAEDDIGESVAGNDSAPNAGFTVAAVYRQRVVRDDRLEGVRDQLEDPCRVERGQQLLVHLEQPALAGELMLELGPLAIQLVEMLEVDDRLGRVAGEDRHRRLVVRAEPIETVGRYDDHAVGLILEAHRHHEHRLRNRHRVDEKGPRVGPGVARQDRLVVLRSPAGQADADGHP